MMLACLFACNWSRVCARIGFWETANARLKTERRQTLDSLQQSKPRCFQNAPKRRLSDFLRSAVSLYLQAVKNAAAGFLASPRRIRLQCRTHRVRAQRETSPLEHGNACRQANGQTCAPPVACCPLAVCGWMTAKRTSKTPETNLCEGQARSARSEGEAEAKFSPSPPAPPYPQPKEIK